MEVVMANQTGGCHCGAVKYEISGDPVFTANCQCSDCQKFSGTGHSCNMAFPEAQANITGELTEYTIKGASGQDITRGFCPTCGTPIYSRSAAIPELVILKAGTLDDPSYYQPQMVIYTKSGQSWDAMPDDLMAFDEMPPRG